MQPWKALLPQCQLPHFPFLVLGPTLPNKAAKTGTCNGSGQCARLTSYAWHGHAIFSRARKRANRSGLANNNWHP